MDNPWKILYTKQWLKDKQIACKAGYGGNNGNTGNIKRKSFYLQDYP